MLCRLPQFTSLKVLFQRRELRVMTALLSRPRRRHLIFTHFASSPQLWDHTKLTKYSKYITHKMIWPDKLTSVFDVLSINRETEAFSSLFAALLVLTTSRFLIMSWGEHSIFSSPVALIFSRYSNHFRSAVSFGQSISRDAVPKSVNRFPKLII